MHYTDPLPCFIIKAVALGLHTLCPLSVCCIAQVVVILDPISPSMPYFRTDTHTNTAMHAVQPIQKLVELWAFFLRENQWCSLTPISVFLCRVVLVQLTLFKMKHRPQKLLSYTGFFFTLSCLQPFKKSKIQNDLKNLKTVSHTITVAEYSPPSSRLWAGMVSCDCCLQGSGFLLTICKNKT